MLDLFWRLQTTKSILELFTTLRQILWHYFAYFARESSRMSTTHVYSRSTCSGFFQPEGAGRNDVKCDITRQFIDHMYWRENISKHLSCVTFSDHKQVQNLSSIPYHWFEILSFIPRTAQFLLHTAITDLSCLTYHAATCLGKTLASSDCVRQWLQPQYVPRRASGLLAVKSLLTSTIYIPWRPSLTSLGC